MKKKIACLLIIALLANLFIGMPVFNIPSYAAGLEDSKVLELKFEDNIEDSSPNKINGTLNGTATYIVGQKGKAISLNGTDNYIDLGTTAALQPQNLTVSLWVYPSTELTGEHMITWFKPSGNYRGNGWYLSCLDDNTPLKLSTGTAPQEAYVTGNRNAFFPAGKWTHIAVTYDSATGDVAIYRNGVAQTVYYTTKVANGIIANNTDRKYIGFNSPGYGFAHAKLGLDEFKIYSTVATEDQIQEIYTSEGGILPVTGVSLDKNTASIDIGEEIELIAAITPARATNKAVTWSSSDNTIAEVDSTGKVTGISTGVATITVKTIDGNFTASCLVTVGNVPVTGVTLDKNNLSISTGQITQLTATVFPVGASNSAVTWSSSDPAVASVDDIGRVTGIKEGTATITVTTVDGNFTASCIVTVTKISYDPYAIIHQFDMSEVSITDPYYINAFNKDVEYLMSLEPDRLLSGFRTAAGLTPKASVYGGWENTLIKGHTMGHYITALAQAYKVTSNDTDTTLNTQIKSRLDYIISELKLCQDANANTPNGAGFLFASDKTQFDILEGKASGSTWVPWYTMHKILTGLIDVYKFTGNDEALTVASNLGDWIYNRVSAWDSSMQARVLGTEYGGMNDCLYELYKITKNPNHLAAAHKFDQDSLFNTIAAGNNTLPGVHANTTIPKFIGALNRYRTLGDSESSYLNAAESFWDMVVNHHTYITGGNSQDEHFRAPDVLDAYRDNVNNETCNTYNMLKLTRELFKVTGDVKYADFYERAFINEIMSSQNPETGMTTYFKPMGTGYFKVFGHPTNNFWCCTGTGMENFTKLNDSIYFHTDNELYVNMYLSSILDWKEKGLKLTAQAQLPDSDEVIFTIDAAPQDEITIKFRSPYWLAKDQDVTLSVNGQIISVSESNGYFDVTRVWKAGDTVKLVLPMEVQVSRLPDNKNAVAFTYGPVVLSAGLGTENMATASHGVSVTIATIPSNVSIKDYIVIKSGSVDEWINDIKNNMIKSDEKVEFTLKNTDEDENLKFTPHYLRYTDRYGIYFVLVAETSSGMPATRGGNVAWYRFDEAAGSVATDSSGNGKDATIIGATGARMGGRFGNALRLQSSGSQYVRLPNGIVSGLNDFTIATWINPSTMATWARIFDFGNGTNTNMFLTLRASSNNQPRFAIRVNGSSEQQLTAGSGFTLSANTWYHIAITKSGNTARMYLNGRLAATNTSMTFNPSDMGVTTNNWIGRSQYSADPYLNGMVDEFSIYDYALSEEEIKALTIIDIPVVQITTEAGVAPVLPDTVTVNYQDGTSGTAAVTWAVIDPALYASEGVFTVIGTVPGAALNAKAEITVNPSNVPAAIISAADSLQPGAIFTAGISLDNLSSGVYAEDIILSYDADVFEYVGTTGANGNIKVLREDASAPGTVRLIAANIGGVSGASTPVLNVSFKVKVGVENTTGSIAVTSAKLGVPDGSIIEAGLSSKVITIGGGIPGVDKSQLITAINNAQTLYDNAEVGTEPGQYPQAARDALKAAIDAAKAVRDDSSATQSQVDSAVTALNNAVNIFKAAVVEEAKPDINDDGIIDVADLGFVAYYYGKECTGTEWQVAKAADMNGDGKIGIEDLAYVAVRIED